MGLHNIKLLAFCCAYKAYRRNSMVHAHDKAYKTAKALGMAEATVRKYMGECRRLGLIVDSRFIKLSDCAALLLSGHPHIKHVHFFAGFEKKPCTKYYYERIKFALAELNYRQQAYRIERNKILDIQTTDRLQTGTLKKLMAMMKKHGVSSIAKLKCAVVRIKEIVSGKYHVARIVGCSPSTGATLLRSWSKAKLIGRRINTDFIHAEQCHGSMLGLIQSGFKYVYPDKKGEGYYLNSGSVITLIENEPTPGL